MTLPVNLKPRALPRGFYLELVVQILRVVPAHRPASIRPRPEGDPAMFSSLDAFGQARRLVHLLKLLFVAYVPARADHAGGQ